MSPFVVVHCVAVAGAIAGFLQFLTSPCVCDINVQTDTWREPNPGPATNKCSNSPVALAFSESYALHRQRTTLLVVLLFALAVAVGMYYSMKATVYATPLADPGWFQSAVAPDVLPVRSGESEGAGTLFPALRGAR